MWGSGFITQLIYASFSEATDNFALLTENVQPLLTESGSRIDIEN